jgi:hypothetical protein
VQGLDLLEEPSSCDVIQGGAEESHVVAVRPPITQPIGIPCASGATDRFQAIFPRSVGFWPVPSSPQGVLCNEPSRATSLRSRPMIRS